MNPDVWAGLLRSVERRRSYDARFFKPVCLIAALDGVADGSLQPSDIDPARLTARFASYVQPFAPDRAEQGWRPMWHLTNDGAWRFARDGVPVRPEDFGPERKPNSRGQLFGRFDHIYVPAEARGLWRSEAARSSLRNGLIAMLESGDEDCRAAAASLGEPALGDGFLEVSAARSPPGGGKGQGFVSDVVVRTEIDRHAMMVVTADFKAKGWAVQDVSATESFDLRCERQGRSLKVEVKGTTGAGDQVQLTAAEVALARAEGDVMALAVVSKIAIERLSDGSAVAQGGALQIYSPWRPSAERLRPVSYVYWLGAEA